MGLLENNHSRSLLDRAVKDDWGTPDREAPVGAKAARSGNFWSPGLNGPTPL